MTLAVDWIGIRILQRNNKDPDTVFNFKADPGWIGHIENQHSRWICSHKLTLEKDNIDWIILYGQEVK